VIVSEVAAQSKTLVTGKPFMINSSEPSHTLLAAKLPQLVSEGILSPSDLEYRSIIVNGSKERFDDLATSNIYGDTLHTAHYRQQLSDQKIKFLVSGELTVSNGACLITVYATDFVNALTPFTTRPTSISQIQVAIDEACDNLNFQIRNRTTVAVQKTIRVLPYSYKYISKGGQEAFSKYHYESDFPALNISNNLAVPAEYVLLPYDFTAREIGKYTVSISGLVTLESDRCTIETTITADGKPYTWASSDKLTNKDQLLTKTLSDVQAFIRVVTRSDFNNMLAIMSGEQQEQDVEASIEAEIKKQNWVTAKLYTENLAQKFNNKANGAGFYRGLILFGEGSYADARSEFLSHAERMREYNEKKWRGRTNYYLGVCNVNLARYDAAARYLRLAEPAQDFSDLSYLRGLCFFKQDSIKDALVLFKDQIAKDPLAAPEVYGFAGLSAQLTNDWVSAEKYFLDGLLSNPDNPVVRKFASDFYYALAIKLVDEKQRDKAYIYFLESYKLTKQFPSLAGAINQGVILNKSDEEIDGLINTGRADKTVTPSILLTVANTCRGYFDPVTSKNLPELLLKGNRYLYRYVKETGKTQYNLLGSSYYRLSMLDLSNSKMYLDSAERNYKKENERRKTPNGLMNLAELQLLKMDPKSAASTLAEVKPAAETTIKAGDEAQKDYLDALYNLYMAQAKILLKVKYGEEQKALLNIIARYDKDKEQKTPLFQTWNFTSYLTFLKTNPKIGKPERDAMMSLLCRSIKVSDKPNLDCSLPK
jgi:hypothetical protein